MGAWITPSGLLATLDRLTGDETATMADYGTDRTTAALNAQWLLSVLKGGGSLLALAYPNSAFCELSIALAGTTYRPKEIIEALRTELAGEGITVPAYSWPADYPDFDGSGPDEAKKVWTTEHIDQWFRSGGAVYNRAVSRYAGDIDYGAVKTIGPDTIGGSSSRVGHGISSGVLTVEQGWYQFDKTQAFNTTNQKWIILASLTILASYDNKGDEGRTYSVGYVTDSAGLSPTDLYNAAPDGVLKSGISYADALANAIVVDITPAFVAANAAGTSPAIKFYQTENPAATMSDVLDMNHAVLWTFFTDDDDPAGLPS